MPASYLTRTTCRVCSSTNLSPLFSLGEQSVSDFVTKDKVHSGHRCPIDLELCNHCTLVQSKHTAPQDFMYTRHYWYRSGVTDTMRKALTDIVDSAMNVVSLNAGDAVLDIGSNDGTLLREYPSALTRIGVEPATNLAEEGRRGISLFINDFWSYGALETYFDQIGGKQPKVITAIGMFYDLEDPNQFIRDVAIALHPKGVFIAQLMCLKNMIDLGDVGNFAHEHLEFYSLASLQHLFAKHGLEIFDCRENEVNGRSYRIYARKAGSKVGITGAGERRWQHFLSLEAGLAEVGTYRTFYRKLSENRDACVNFIKGEVMKGRGVWVYGASTKGNVILQWYGLDNRVIGGAAERSPEKVGKYTIETGIPICSEEQFRHINPDYALVLPYAFINEFVNRESWYRQNGGKFLVPLPQFKVV